MEFGSNLHLSMKLQWIRQAHEASAHSCKLDLRWLLSLSSLCLE